MKKKRTALLQRAFVLKRTALFEDFLLLRIVSTKKKFVSLSHREHTKHEYTFLLYSFAPHLLLKSFRFAAAIE